ncbi:histidine kinase [Hyphomicrobium methylovorum]|uniref:sensor histidine kinase n=1 Tax=Hyphomicrobium methylovorum TaxID=84 RepID=UPI0015E68E55|nr:histidine kinase [Hyphomicrobium methylovorum]MBA2127633.1 histidine kinase [Hyphomicrobium methylovorum]
MPLRRRLLLLVALVLAACLLVASVLTYWAGLRKIDLEMSSAIEVGDSAVMEAMASIDSSTDPAAHVRRTIASFNGDRHLVARLIGPDGEVVDVSQLKPPADPPPAWLFDLLGRHSYSRTFPLPGASKNLGQLRIDADPHNEVSEVWEDLKLKLLIVTAFCAVVLSLIYAILGRALRPLEDLSAALHRIGQGDYTAKVSETGPQDLQDIYRAFNRMADELNASEQQNHRLNEQLSTVLEEERSEIARDLHDEIGPFLFAVDVDAQSIPSHLSRDAKDAVSDRAKAIRQNVQHMQLHLRSILSRLRPALLIDQGLDHAVENLIAFWRTRRPGITFNSQVTNERFPANIEETAFRILQEGTSNAVRHGKPSTITLTARISSPRTLEVTVSDDGTGLSATSNRGFGLIGMRERIAILGGKLNVVTSNDAQGVTLIAELPLPEKSKQTRNSYLATSAA